MQFIHIADVHLGAVPDSGRPWSALREKEIWGTFRRLIGEIRENPVDLLLIAGDFFHRQPLRRELREVNELFAMIPDTQIVWMAGNHDHMKRESAYRKMNWAPNVHGFFSETQDRIFLGNLHTWVYGLSYEHGMVEKNLYTGIHPNGQPGIHILLAHGGEEHYSPFTKQDLEAFDYAALGHIHKPGVLIPGKAAYAGALEPLDRKDRGPRGYIRGEIHANGANGKAETQFQFVPFSCRIYEDLDITIHSKTTQIGLETRIREAVEQKGSENMYRIYIRGYRSPDLEFDTEPLYALGQITQVQDLTRPRYDLQKLRREREGTVVARYIDAFGGQMDAADVRRDFMNSTAAVIDAADSMTMDSVEQKALYYGLWALLEQDD